jgi:hypothetical protein
MYPVQLQNNYNYNQPAHAMHLATAESAVVCHPSPSGPLYPYNQAPPQNDLGLAAYNQSLLPIQAQTNEGRYSMQHHWVTTSNIASAFLHRLSPLYTCLNVGIGMNGCWQCERAVLIILEIALLTPG